MRKKAMDSCRLQMPTTLVLPFLLLASALYSSLSAADESFDVRQHLSTVSSYGAVKDVVDNSFVPTKIPDECKPIHLNLVARHGTRSPTKKRMKELEVLSDELVMLVANAEKNKVPREKIPSWFAGWQSPWKGKVKGGELIIKGEREHYELALRIKERYADLFSEEYHPDVYPIKATQVPRASASAVAFGMGLFRGKGVLGQEKSRAFAITTETRASDTLLRFHDTCKSYKKLRKSQEPAVEKIKEPIFDKITDTLSRRHELNFTRQHISSLWFLCKQEASLLDITNQACQLFSPDEVALLEWTDDLELFVLKGYGKSLNYRMGVPLLNDVYQSMESAIKDNEEAKPAGSYEKSRLRFAHAETIVPFSCLLGLFLKESDFKQILREQPLELPVKPPQKRAWRGSTVAPFAGNNMLVLYSCPANKGSKYFVHALHNEHPIPLPGCGNSAVDRKHLSPSTSRVFSSKDKEVRLAAPSTSNGRTPSDNRESRSSASAVTKNKGCSDESDTDSVDSDVYGSEGDDDTSWISWFCNLRGNEFFCEVDEDYIQDDFNLCSLSSQVPYYEYALDLILDIESSNGDLFTEEQNELIESAAEMLYGLIHVRYILTGKGMSAMLEKYKNFEFGRCPRVYCSGQACLPVGQSDIPRSSTVKIYCPKCEDVHYPRSKYQGSVDGAYFGTTFPHLFLMTYPSAKPPKPVQSYVPRVFGFKIHKT